MGRERGGQLSLADGLVAPGLGSSPRLERIAAWLHWPALESELASV